MSQVVKYSQGRTEIWFVNGEFFCHGDVNEFLRHVKTEFKHSFMNADNSPPMTIAAAERNVIEARIQSAKDTIARAQESILVQQEELERMTNDLANI